MRGDAAFASKVFALEFDLADRIWLIQVGVLGPFFDVNAGPVSDVLLGGELDGAPEFDRDVIEQGGVERKGGPAPYAGEGVETERGTHSDIRMWVEKTLKG